MYKVEFIYQGKSIVIQCYLNERMEDIIVKFETKAEIEKNIVYYLYNGEKMNKEIIIDKIINQNDRENKVMKIIVNEIEKIEKDKYIISKNIICPECNENCRIKIEDYLIDLYDCKNKHNLYNISLDKFEETQKINISKIICEECKEKNKIIHIKMNFINV